MTFIDIGCSWKLDNQGSVNYKCYHLHRINFQICFCRKLWQNKTFPIKKITFVDIRRFRKLDNQVSVKAPNANIHVKCFQIYFRGKLWQNNTFPTKLITFVDIGRSWKLDHRGSVKAPIRVRWKLRTRFRPKYFRQYWTFSEN